MARTYATVSVTRGSDPDWRKLTFAEQGFYDFLLSHPKLSLCGVLDVKPTIWTKAAADADMDHLMQLMVDLEAARYIRWDRDTDEVGIRTFVRHDGVLKNRNLGKGMWSAWSIVESEELRFWLVDNFPETAFEQRFEPPISALRNHRRNHSSNQSSDQGSNYLIPTTTHLDPASAGDDERFEHLEDGSVKPLRAVTP